MAETRRQSDEAIQALKRERAVLERQRRDDSAEIGRIGTVKGMESPARAELEARLASAAQRLAEIRGEFDFEVQATPTEEEVAAALADFDAVWDALAPRDQNAVLEQLVDRVEFDGVTGQVAITFQQAGIQTLGEAKPKNEETAA